ncbi:hypothetical protein DM01DRAFT_1337096, partial [Hesseltinella vesiculosa]
MGQSSSKAIQKDDTPLKTPTQGHHPDALLSLLTRAERRVLREVFQKAKASSNESAHVDLQSFLNHLALPADLEQAGILLFKVFSHAGAYPECSLSSPPVPLDWPGFSTAWIVASGLLDKSMTDDQHVFDMLLFQALAILPRPTAQPPGPVEEDQPQPTPQRHHVTQAQGLSLADLGISFTDDLDVDSGSANPTQTTLLSDTLSIPRVDLVHFLSLALWIGSQSCSAQHHRQPHVDMAAHCQQLAHDLVQSMGDTDTISNTAFTQWKQRQAPFLCQSIQSFIYSRFTSMDSDTHVLIQPGDQPSIPDTSALLNDTLCTMLSWTFRSIQPTTSKSASTRPDRPTSLTASHTTQADQASTSTAQWHRLYSGDLDGFAMNRFENRVFKYSGPTLLVLRGQWTVATDMEDLIMAVLITEPWKHGRHYWGAESCRLVELQPHFEVSRPTGRHQQVAFFLGDLGIGFGGLSNYATPSRDHPTTLFLDNSLQAGQLSLEPYPSQPTFEPSTQWPLQQQTLTFDLVDLEVFGLGDPHALQQQKKAWQFDANEAVHRSGVRVRQQDGQVDKEILRMAGLLQEFVDTNEQPSHSK